MFPLVKFNQWLVRNLKTPELTLIKVLSKSVYFKAFGEMRKTEMGRTQTKKIMLILMNIINSFNARQQRLNIIVLFELIYEIITNKYQIHLKIKRRTHLRKHFIQADKSNLYNYIIDLIAQEPLKTKVQEKPTSFTSMIDLDLFFKKLTNYGASSKRQRRSHKIEFESKVKLKKGFFKKFGQGYLLNHNGQNLPVDYYDFDKNKMKELFKKTKLVSLKDGKFSTDLSVNGTKINGITVTNKIDDFSNFLGSSLAYMSESPDFFVKQLLEKKIYKLEKPSVIQDEKKYRFNLFFVNGVDAQSCVTTSQGEIKYFTIMKILSQLMISDLALIFSDIKHWNIDILYYYLPIISANSAKNNVDLIDMALLTSKIKDFVSFKDFTDIFTIIQTNTEKLCFNTINYGEGVLSNIDAIENRRNELLCGTDDNKARLGQSFSLFFVVIKSENEKAKVKREIYTKFKDSHEKVYILFFVKHEGGQDRIIFENVSSDYSNEESYYLSEGFKRIRADFLEIIIKEL